MGRESVAQAEWMGRSAQVKAIAEAHEIILRGAIKARLPRNAVTAVLVENGVLTVEFGQDRLRLELGAQDATKWHALLTTSPPSLAEKLGISGEKPGFVMGRTDDPALGDALIGRSVDDLATAALLVSVINTDDDLARTIETAYQSPDKAVWCIYPKGKAASPGDAAIRQAMRDAGFKDSKSCSVSERLTATRYSSPVRTGRSACS